MLKPVRLLATKPADDQLKLLARARKPTPASSLPRLTLPDAKIRCTSISDRR